MIHTVLINREIHFLLKFTNNENLIYSIRSIIYFGVFLLGGNLIQRWFTSLEKIIICWLFSARMEGRYFELGGGGGGGGGRSLQASAGCADLHGGLGNLSAIKF